MNYLQYLTVCYDWQWDQNIKQLTGHCVGGTGGAQYVRVLNTAGQAVQVLYLRLCFGSGFTDSGSSILCWIPVPIRIRIQGLRPKIEKNVQLKKNLKFFWKKIAIYLSLGLHKRHIIHRRSLQPSKENIQHFKTWNFLTFYIIVGHFCPPGPGSVSTDLIDYSGYNPKHRPLYCGPVR